MKSELKYYVFLVQKILHKEFVKSRQVLLMYVQQFIKYLVYPWGIFVSLVHN
jgi:hypothetical protein